MAIFRDPLVVTSTSFMPSLGSLIGSRVTTEVFEQVNNNGHASVFGNEFEHLDRAFFERHVKPMNDLNFQIERTVNMILNPDYIRTLSSFDDFKSIPTCMEMPILLFAPVRELFEQGRIEGFNYTPDTLPDEDMYGRLIDNFTCEDVDAASDEDGRYTIEATLYSDDEDFTDDQLLSIRRTREFILNGILNNTDRDPTAIELPRG